MCSLQDATVHPAIPVILEGEGDSWSAFVPGVPGCIAAGRSREEILREIESALAFYFREAHRDGLTDAAEAEDDPDLRVLADAANATLTIEEAAQTVGAGISAITSAVRRGELTGIVEPDERRGGRRRVRRVYRQEVERWAAAHAGQVERKPRRVRSA
jgi:predicted RNase H-like HicB family nuclease